MKRRGINILANLRKGARMSKVKLQCWISRDEDGELNIGTSRPTLDSEKRRWVNWHDFMELPKDFFQELTLKNSPQRVEMTIEIKNYGKEEGT